MKVIDIRRKMLGTQIIHVVKIDDIRAGYTYNYFGLNKNFNDSMVNNKEIIFIEPKTLDCYQIEDLTFSGEYAEAQEGLIGIIDSYIVIHLK